MHHYEHFWLDPKFWVAVSFVVARIARPSSSDPEGLELLAEALGLAGEVRRGAGELLDCGEVRTRHRRDRLHGADDHVAPLLLLDGGVRRGTDVLKALALGAKAVFVGRPAMYGLAVGGQAGVAHALELLRREIDVDLALLGCPDVTALTSDYLAREGDPT